MSIWQDVTGFDKLDFYKIVSIYFYNDEVAYMEVFNFAVLFIVMFMSFVLVAFATHYSSQRTKDKNLIFFVVIFLAFIVTLINMFSQAALRQKTGQALEFSKLINQKSKTLITISEDLVNKSNNATDNLQLV